MNLRKLKTASKRWLYKRLAYLESKNLRYCPEIGYIRHQLSRRKSA